MRRDSKNHAIVPPGRRGFRWPAEWEPHAATWLSWPHNKETWPDRLDEVEESFCEIVRTLAPAETVKINVEGEAMEERVRRRLADAGVTETNAIEFHFVPTNDAWIRDHGGIFLVASGAAKGGRAAREERLLLDFEFDAWGGKYPPWDLDARVAREMAEIVGVDSFESPYVLEAGAIDGDGEGTVLTTESCLLNSNRLRPGQNRSREGIEELLADTLGTQHVIWLGGGIEGDDTDGHVDDLTRFVAPGRVVTIVETDRSDSDFEALAENRRRLDRARDADGRSLDIVELPTPGAILSSGGRLPASYANFYIGNAAVLVPTFGADADAEALGVLQICFPDREVVPIPSRALVEGLGTIHCLTQQEPALGADQSAIGSVRPTLPVT